MKKLIVLTGLLICASCAAHAALEGGVYTSSYPVTLSPGSTTTDEFLFNQGYSDEVGRLIEIRTKDPMAPIEGRDYDYERSWNWRKIGNKVAETFDPTMDTKHFGERNIHYGGVSVEDL